MLPGLVSKGVRLKLQEPDSWDFDPEPQSGGSATKSAVSQSIPAEAPVLEPSLFASDSNDQLAEDPGFPEHSGPLVLRGSEHTPQGACVWEPHFRPHAQPQIYFRGVGYCSLSEASFALLLEYFIPGFDIVPGKTFQVAIGSGRSVDFCINGTLIEYHQLRLHPSRGKFGDFGSEAEFKEYRRVLQRLRGNSHKRALLSKIVHQRLAGNYFRKRRAFLDQSPHFSQYELIVATTRDEFYDLVVRPFAIVEVPSNRLLEDMFWRGVKQVAAEQR